MPNDDQFRAPAGWYPDPLGLPQLRWWNNQGWTEQVSHAPEPLIVHETRFAWKVDEQPTAPSPAAAATREPASPRPAAAESLRALNAPRSAETVQEPSTYTKYTHPGSTAATAATPPPPPIAQTPPPPPYWDDEDEQSLPEPSVRPEDLKFWPGTNPAELLRQARQQAARAAGTS